MSWISRWSACMEPAAGFIPLRHPCGTLRLAETVLVAITSDITERKRLEIMLVAEATRNRLFLRTASDGVHILDRSGHIVDVSESFCRMLGYRARGSDRDVSDPVGCATDGGGNTRDIVPTLRSGELNRFKTLHRRKDGSVFPVEIHTERFDVEGQQYEYCSSRDMTDQRRLERALLEATSNEQHKLGRDVHDGLGQELAGISMLATAIATSLKKAGRPEAAQMADLAQLCEPGGRQLPRDRARPLAGGFRRRRTHRGSAGNGRAAAAVVRH